MLSKILCMLGNIYTRQKCLICGSNMHHDEAKCGCFCPNHPQEAATRFYIRFKGLYQNFQDYGLAARKLNALRYYVDMGTFDVKDHQKNAPHGFTTLAKLYLRRKEDKRSYGHIERYMNRAIEYFGQRNVKMFTGAIIEDFLYSIEGIGKKTMANHASQLNDFFKWVLKRGVITLAQMPVIPDIDYELGRRKITDLETQALVLNTVKEISAHVNEKIWLGCDMLATYTALRPDDLRRVYEDSLDDTGFLTIHNPTKKKNKFKVIRLLEKHVVEWRRLHEKYPGHPNMPYFRHKPNARGCSPNSIFGPVMFHKWWKRACEKVGLEGVSLYPGTKHTLATATAKALGTDRALEASGLTNKAFERYCQVENYGVFETVKAMHELRTRKK